MITFEPAQAAIFDVDDTLLNNWPDPDGNGLHAMSRLEALHTVGRKHNLDGLTAITPAESRNAFLSAPVHSVDDAVWMTLRRTGLVDDTDIVDRDNELLREIVELKNELHGAVPPKGEVAVTGASEFVRAIYDAGLTKLAIASSAVRRDVDLSLQIVGVADLFPPSRIISHENLTKSKPDPECFNLAFASLGLPASDRPYTWAFEDDPRGITAARAAGLFVCAITTRHPRAKLEALPVAPDVVADSYDEFAYLLDVPQT